MIFIETKKGTANEKFPDFVSSVVKNIGLPFGMKSLLRVGMLVEMSAVKIDKPMLITRKVRRNPV
jgi:hypothetical protein